MKKAFTLAEVLITIGIIGVVAALTVPSLITDIRERENVSKLKKFYTNIGQSYVHAVSIWGTPDYWELDAAGSGAGAEKLSSILSPYFRIHKNCKNDGGCWYDKTIFLLNNTPSGLDLRNDTSYATVQITDGMLFAYKIIDSECKTSVGDNKGLDSVCAIITVDLNEKKGPNQIGYDIHNFYITKYNIQPFGQEVASENTFKDHCAQGRASDGYGCTAWVLYKENLDYLHCSNLAWDGLYRCKGNRVAGWGL